MYVKPCITLPSRRMQTVDHADAWARMAQH